MRFYFDIEGEGAATIDGEGCECESLLSMRLKTVEILAEIAGDHPRNPERVELVAWVRDTGGVVVHKARLTILGGSN
jgi:hypothetical protein